MSSCLIDVLLYAGMLAVEIGWSFEGGGEESKHHPVGSLLFFTVVKIY